MKGRGLLPAANEHDIGQRQQDGSAVPAGRTGRWRGTCPASMRTCCREIRPDRRAQSDRPSIPSEPRRSESRSSVSVVRRLTARPDQSGEACLANDS